MNARRSVVALVASLGVLVMVLVAGSAPALAAGGYGFTGSFGSKGSGDGQFEGPVGVAVNPTSKDVYVVDRGNNRVEYFSSAGVFEHQFNGIEIDGVPAAKKAPVAFSEPSGIAVAPSGDVYVIDLGHNVVDRFTATGEFKEELKETEGASGGIAGVAVDPSGNVWLYSNNSQAVEFNHEGVYVPGSSFNTAKGVSPGLAVDSLDHLYIITAAHNARLITPPAPEGVLVNTETERVSGVAVDQSSGDVYVDQGNEVFQDGPLGEPLLDQFGFGAHLAAGTGLAVSSVGTVYVADSLNDDVAMFAPGVGEPPGVESESSSGVTPFAATLEAVVNPEFGETSCEFVYGTEPLLLAGTTSVACKPEHLGAGNSGKGATVAVAGLKPTEKYFYRVVVSNAIGTEKGAIQEFETLGEKPPVVESEGVSRVNAVDARLEAEVNPDYEATTVIFEYSTKETGGVLQAPITVVTGASIPAGIGAQHVSADLSSVLKPNEKYFYRVVAENATSKKEGIPATGEVKEFTTLIAPVLTTAQAQNVITAGATLSGAVTLSGTIDPEGVQTSYHYAYIEQASYEEALFYGGALREIDPAFDPYAAGGSTPEITVAAEQAVLATEPFVLSGLAPGATYHYALVARNTAGTIVISSGETFTVPGTLPVVQPPEVTFTPAPAPRVASTLTGILGTPLLALPNITFPPEEAGTSVTTKKTAKHCPKGKKRSHNRCVKTKSRRKTKAKKAGENRRTGR